MNLIKDGKKKFDTERIEKDDLVIVEEGRLFVEKFPARVNDVTEGSIGLTLFLPTKRIEEFTFPLSGVGKDYAFKLYDKPNTDVVVDVGPKFNTKCLSRSDYIKVDGDIWQVREIEERLLTLNKLKLIGNQTDGELSIWHLEPREAQEKEIEVIK